jgi:hypothetical protein
MNNHDSDVVLECPGVVPPLERHEEAVSLLDVTYFRATATDGGDLYLTQFGLPFREQLDPANWHAPDWFAAHRTRLPGTSVIYKVPTRPSRGMSINLVVRFSRVGEEVPLDRPTLCKYPDVEFNSPFEEFALVMQLRAARPASGRARILTKRPLAIWVPAERVQLWQTGRVEGRIAAKLARHPEVELDIQRQYVLLYGWIDGLNAVQAVNALGMTGSSRDAFLDEATRRARHDLSEHGFRMIDIKPEHVVLRFRPDGSLLRWPDGHPIYALVDYELLERFGDS